jgi:5-(carboxyamino)imidazole ribonucleotide synthase
VSEPILPGATIGMLGGGQLGRMFALAARAMGYRVAVLVPEHDSPTAQVADVAHEAAYDDVEAVERFASQVSVVTYEFENVPSATVEAAERHAPVRPGRALLHAVQERSREKQALADLGLPVAPFAVIDSAADLEQAGPAVGFPSILKTAAWGYDGKGQRRVASAGDLVASFGDLGSVRTVLEREISFVAEASVIGARSLDGDIAVYEPFLNHHANHILDVTVVPAGLSPATAEAAEDAVRTILEGFDVVGLLCVELFILGDGSVLVNEVAPRPHNSGHVTIDAHATNQFAQQVRAVCGLPLGSTEMVVPAAAMANLLGDVWANGEPDWPAALATPGSSLHLYGKAKPRPGRKMGHLTATGANPTEAEARARAARAAL